MYKSFYNIDCLTYTIFIQLKIEYKYFKSYLHKLSDYDIRYNYYRYNSI